MAGPWDNIMKWLVGTHGEHFARWLIPAAIFLN